MHARFDVIVCGDELTYSESLTHLVEPSVDDYAIDHKVMRYSLRSEIKLHSMM